MADIGTGSGFYALEAARRVGHSGRVYAVDVQKDLLDRLRNQAASLGLRNLEVVWGDAEKINGTRLGDRSVDRVVASNVIFQARKRDDMALELKRIIKPGGRLLIIDWSGASPMSPKTLATEASVKAMFEKYGFKEEQSFRAGDHHYGLIFSIQ